MTKQEQLKDIPSVSSLLDSADGQALTSLYGPKLITHLLRSEIDSLRSTITTGSNQTKGITPSAQIFKTLNSTLSIFSPAGRKVINATGIILHTGLGRSPLSASSISALTQLGSYSLLEVDEATGDRGLRERDVELLLQALVGCEAATVVNNNAAATFMALRAIAAKKEVVISRGQLIEIGGSYRLPDVMRLSGCKLSEVGTTNITRAEDYEAAITLKTGAILHVHTSNYRIKGFHSTPSLSELRAIADKYKLPLIEDLGSGALVELTQFGLNDEQLVAKSLADGADVVCFSGDKLLGGPQAGVICGKREFVSKIRKDQFFRMFRPEKLTLLALETTLLAFSRGDFAEQLPIYRFLARPIEDLRALADKIVAEIGQLSGDVQIAVTDSDAYLGGGTLPEERLPSVALKISPSAGSATSSWVNKVSNKLRSGSPRIFSRIEKGSIYLDLKTVTAKECGQIAGVLKSAL